MENNWDYNERTGVITVYDANMQRIGDAQICDQTEAVYVDYFDDSGIMDEFGCASSDLYFSYENNPAAIASWIVETHPNI